MSAQHPYRAEPGSNSRLPVLMVEAPNCRWCRWGTDDYVLKCSNPAWVTAYAKQEVRELSVFNRSGGHIDCGQYSPNLLTRLLRRFGIRAPALIDSDPD